MLQGLTGSDQPDFVFFEHKHHVVARLEPECFAVGCGNDESAPSRLAGKRSKVALVACMRKLITILNAMVKHGMPWAPVVQRT